MHQNITLAKTLIYNILSLELKNHELLTDELVMRFAEDYHVIGEIHLTDQMKEDLDTQEEEYSGLIEADIKVRLDLEFSRYKPSEDKAFEDSAPIIVIKINGRAFDTYLDKQGVQRFKTNTVMQYLYDKGKFDLNQMAMEYYTGNFSNDDWLTFYTSFSYSVAGLSDLSYFSAYDFDNPLWN